MTKQVLILGGGESGIGCCKLAKKLGMTIFLSDSGAISEKYKQNLKALSIEFEEGGHSESILKKYNYVVKSPGIPNNAEVIQKLQSIGNKIISELEFAYPHTNAKIIGITGTNGKTTTTALTHHILQKAGLNVGVGGNIGKSFAGLVAEKEYEYIVLEISSFQLENLEDFKPQIAMILNITEDHLERHGNMQEYIKTKFQITKNLTEDEILIYEKEDKNIDQYLKVNPIKAKKLPISLTQTVAEGAYFDNDKEQIIIQINQKQLAMSIHELALQGKHNIYNSMAASVASRVLEIRKEIIRESLSDFQNVEHRLEFVSAVCGVKYINDSKATNVNSAWYALESADSPVIWIAGGVDKGNDYTALLPLVRQKVKAIICLGLDNEKLKNFFKEDIELIFEANNMRDCVGIAYKLAQKEDTVLLSPACASFDLFENYEDRGHQFKETVRAL